MKIYLAARYSRHPEMQEVARLLAEHGHHVTSRWIWQHGGELEKSFTPERLGVEPEFCGRYASIDVEDLVEAEAVVSFTGNGGGGKGGRHVEFGMAVALGRKLIIVGPRENVFHCLPEVEIVESNAELCALLSPPPSLAPPSTQVIDLMESLRASLRPSAAPGSGSGPKAPAAPEASPSRNG